jgi:hypothetical protein
VLTLRANGHERNEFQRIQSITDCDGIGGIDLDTLSGNQREALDQRSATNDEYDGRRSPDNRQCFLELFVHPSATKKCVTLARSSTAGARNLTSKDSHRWRWWYHTSLDLF